MILLQNNQNNAMAYEDTDICPTLPASMGMGGGYIPMIVEPIVFVDDPTIKIDEDGTAFSIRSRDYKGVQCVSMKTLSTHKQYFHIEAQEDFVATLTATDYKDPPTVTMVKEREEDDMMQQPSIVRRLTPTECERLQGFPDGWTDIGEWTDSKGKVHKPADSPRYKALGNSIAVGYANGQSGFWCWLARRICAQYERQITMASLFDGIGGFPLAFSAAGAIPVWASEIEEFPIAVTKIRFPEEE